MYSVFDVEVLAAATEARHKDKLREAECARAVQKAGAAEPKLTGRVLAGIGSFLISTGQKLQGQYAPMTPHSAKAHQSGC